MNILFLTLGRLYDLKSSDIYTDLMREFLRHGHRVTIVTPYERSMRKNTECYEADGATILAVKTLNIQHANIIEKGLGTLLIGWQYERAIKKYLGKERFDLVTYSTPPITLASVVRYVKKKFGAKSYLQLKDIFPQNAVDIGMLQGMPVHGSWLTVHGWVARAKYQLYKYFRRKEKKLYALSNYIGCMSPANVEYVLKHNSEIGQDKVGICPNAIELWPHRKINRAAVRERYGLPVDKPVLLYGGNLGKPQGIDFLVSCLKMMANREDCHFLIVGSGTDAHKVDEFIEADRPKNITKIAFLPKEDYYQVVASCDIGLIFLDHRFTIPNFPSRLLPYLDFKMPVICATDRCTDIGRIVQENGFGMWCESMKPEDFVGCVEKMLRADYKLMGEKGYEFLKDNYQVGCAYESIMKHVETNGI